MTEKSVEVAFFIERGNMNQITIVRVRREITYKRPKYLSGNKPFNRLPLKQRAIFILHTAGMTYRDIQKLSIATPKSISRAIKKGYEEYRG